MKLSNVFHTPPRPRYPSRTIYFILGFYHVALTSHRNWLIIGERALSCLFFAFTKAEKPTRSFFYQIVCRECRHNRYRNPFDVLFCQLVSRSIKPTFTSGVSDRRIYHPLVWNQVYGVAVDSLIRPDGWITPWTAWTLILLSISAYANLLF